MGWRVLTVWQCELSNKVCLETVRDQLSIGARKHHLIQAAAGEIGILARHPVRQGLGEQPAERIERVGG
jgi:hypothetical protein